jgi:hypothetical protein
MDSHQLIREDIPHWSVVMAAILRLVETSNRDTVSVLRHLLSQALEGRITAVAVAFRTPQDRADNFVFSGIYHARPGAAVNAAALMKWKLTLAQDSSFN